MSFTVSAVWAEMTTHARGCDRGYSKPLKVQEACNHILGATKRMVRRFSAPLSSGTPDYILPSDCTWNGLRDLRFYDSTTAPGVNKEGTEIRIMPEGLSVPGTGNPETGSPLKAYLVMGSAPNEGRQYVRVVPTPGTVEAGKYLMFRYQARSVRLTADTDIVPLDDDSRICLVYCGAWLLSASIAPKDAEVFFGFYQRELSRILNFQAEDQFPQEYPQVRSPYDVSRTG